MAAVVARRDSPAEASDIAEEPALAAREAGRGIDCPFARDGLAAAQPAWRCVQARGEEAAANSSPPAPSPRRWASAVPTTMGAIPSSAQSIRPSASVPNRKVATGLRYRRLGSPSGRDGASPPVHRDCVCKPRSDRRGRGCRRSCRERGGSSAGTSSSGSPSAGTSVFVSSPSFAADSTSGGGFAGRSASIAGRLLPRLAAQHVG